VPAALEFFDVSKEYRSWPGRKRVLALQDFSLSVQTGEIFGFLGPNGAGKSTAIHLAMGFMRPSAGGGQMLGKPFGEPTTRRRVGFLAENVALYNRRAESAIRFYGALNGLYGRALSDAVRRALTEVDLLGEARRNLGQFSRGMLQRSGLAQAIVNDPELLLLDEPTSALDPAARVAVRELLLRWREKGKTIFLSSHLLSEVELVCDRVAILSDGRIVRVGPLSAMLETSDRVEIVFRAPVSLPGGPDPLLATPTKLTATRTGLRATMEKLWSEGAEIISVNPVRRSLEDLFLEVTADKARGGRGVGRS